MPAVRPGATPDFYEQGEGMMLTPKGRQLVWGTASGFVLSHCMNCAAGWTRTGTGGGTLTVCLLDREPVLDGMTDCSHYEARKPAE